MFLRRIISIKNNSLLERICAARGLYVRRLACLLVLLQFRGRYFSPVSLRRCSRSVTRDFAYWCLMLPSVADLLYTFDLGSWVLS